MTPNDQLEALLQLLLIEKQEEIERHQSFVNETGIGKRVDAGVTWFPLKISDTGFGMGERPFLVVENIKAKHKNHQFQAGQTVRVFSDHPRADEEELHGNVHYVDGNRMKVILYNDEHPEWLDLGRLGVDLLLDIKTYKEMELALYRAMQAKENRLAQLRDILLGDRKPGYDMDFAGTPPEHLNPSQKEAVQHILSAHDIALVHGPPGTGKTTTLVAAAQQLAERGEQLLVCAASNAATDHFALQLHRKGLKVVRVGNLSRIDEAMMELTLEGMLTNHSEYKQIKQLKRRADEFRRMAEKYKRNFGHQERNQRRQLFKEAREIAKEAIAQEDYLIDQMLDSADVIATTLTSSSNVKIRDRHFNTLIVDEAAQALDPAIWIALSKAGKLVLAGDPFQLPPTVKSQQAADGGLGVTLLEKSLQKFERSALLKTQYRMHRDIMNFSNEMFYDNQLEADPSVAERGVGDDLPIEFIDTAGCGYEEQQQESLSYNNPGEATILVKHLCALLDCNYAIEDIGLISPYREQVNFLQSHLDQNVIPHENQPPITAQTVDAFQGQERDVIYVTLVRSNEDQKIGFLKDTRRMNVAMTRARKKLVVIGDSATIGSHPFYNAFLQYAERKDAYRSAFEFIDY